MKNKLIFLNIFIVFLMILISAGIPTVFAGDPLPDVSALQEASNAMPAPIIEFPGIPRVPPDPIPNTSGAAGHTHYLQAADHAVALFRKDGGVVDASTLAVFFGYADPLSPCYPQNSSVHEQPYVLYDHMAGRWVIADVAYDDVDDGPYYICIAVSNGLIPPFGGPYFNDTYWNFYAFSTNEGSNHYYPDSPKLGLWPDGYYLSVDLFDVFNNGLNRTPRGVKVWALNRDDLVNGVISGYRYVDFYLNEHMNYEHLLPTNLLGNPPPTGTPNYFASIQPGKFHIWEFHVDWIDPSRSTFGTSIQEPNHTINTDTGTSWAIGYIIPQKDVFERVEVHGERLMSPLQYRILDGIPSLWATHSVLSNDVTGIRWYEIQYDSSDAPFFYQQGTYQPDSNYRWMSSLAVDRAGNMAVGFSRSSNNEFPSIRYAGRLKTDPAGELAQGEAVLYNGTGSQDDGDLLYDGPWGRQSQMSVDPLDECVFWYTNMYYDSNGLDWRTRIGWFSFPQCRGGATHRISLSTENVEGNNTSGVDFETYSVAISATGRYVAFSSEATNLVSGDTNDRRDIFLRDRDPDGDGIYDEADAVKTTRISNGIGGAQSNGDSWEVSITKSGRYIAFSSDASNLVSGDNKGTRDVFVYDRIAATTVRASVADKTGNEGNASSDNPFIAGDGRYVAFRSHANNLVAGDTNTKADIFLRDLSTGRTYRVSKPDPSTGFVQANGESATPTLSDNARFIAFASRATNLVLGDINGAMDVFVHDLAANTTRRVSITSFGIQGNADSYTPYISGNSRYIAFASRSTNLDSILPDNNGFADIFVHDRVTLVTSRVSVNFFGIEAMNGDSYSPSISRDGRYIAFASDASNLDVTLPDFNNRRDIFLHDRELALMGVYDVGLTYRISLDHARNEPNDWSFAPVVAPLGRHVAFVSEATDLVVNDRNNAWDVFAFDNQRGIPTFLSIPANIPGGIGQIVTMPIFFTSHDQNIDTTTFSVDFDEVCLEFDPEDANGDGIPDAITFYTPGDFTLSASYDGTDKDGEIDFSIYDQTAPRASIPDGMLATMDFKVKATCQAAPDSSESARVGFSTDPRPSFATLGQSVYGLASDGFVRILPGKLGDCNGDGNVDAGDLSGLVLEIFDGDDVLPGDTPGGTFPGNSVGCNPNQDYVVDAGDLSCTILIIWGGGTASCTNFANNVTPLMLTDLLPSEGNTADSDMLILDIPDKVPAVPGSNVEMKIDLQTKGKEVNSLVFSIDFDESWLNFDPADDDSNGIPDAITPNLPQGFQIFSSYDGKDEDGELDLVIYNPGSPSSSLDDGYLLSIQLETGEAPDEYLAEVNASRDPQPSFGDVNGQSILGQVDDGSVRISDVYYNYLYLPVTINRP